MLDIAYALYINERCIKNLIESEVLHYEKKQIEKKI